MDNDSTQGFYKWPFMTTHAWAEQSRGLWTLEIRFDNEDNGNTPLKRPRNLMILDRQQDRKLTTGSFSEWSLLLHGTKMAPYANQIPSTIRGDKSKLSVAKQIHANNFQDKAKYV